MDEKRIAEIENEICEIGMNYRFHGENNDEMIDMDFHCKEAILFFYKKGICGIHFNLDTDQEWVALVVLCIKENIGDKFGYEIKIGDSYYIDEDYEIIWDNYFSDILEEN